MRSRFVLIALAWLPLNVAVAQSAPPVAGEVFPASELKQPPKLQRSLARYYPADESYAKARVTVEFVVDTAGLVEPGTVKIIQSPTAAFAEAARLTVVAQQYAAGSFGGAHIRSLMNTDVSFKPGKVSCALVIESHGTRLCFEATR